jgi:pimeloyl-ACP methyl ester carboxylesterase
MAMMRVLLVATLLIAAVLAIQPPSNEYRKKLQGPASEFAQHRIPQPALAAQTSDSAWYDLTFTKADDGSFVWKGDIVVDSQTEFDFSIFSPYEDKLDVVLQPPSAQPFSLKGTLAARRHFKNDPTVGTPFTSTTGPFGVDGASVPVTTYTFEKPVVGTWSAQVIIRGVDVPTGAPAAMAMVSNRGSLELFSHLNQYELEVGQEVGLVANLFEGATTEGVRPAALLTAAVQPMMVLSFPSGRQVQVAMHDDGLHADMLAGDGVFGGVVEALEPGQYSARAVFEGTTAEGARFVRSSEHSFQVVSPFISLTGLADVEYKKEDKAFYFHLDVDVYPTEITAVKAYAEVWGTDASGYEYAPVAWMQSMVDAYKNEATGDYVITLMLHEDWVHNAKVSAPFQLRNVWIQDRDWNVLMSERTSVFVDSSALKNFRPDLTRRAVSITEEMRVGPRPAAMQKMNNITRAQAGSGTLLLVHGYCANQNEFPVAHFDNAVQFQDYGKSRSNDEFALKIREFGNQFPAFSIVSHSQGGLAATHLHAYYWSNLENAQGGRLVQSVGSPYYGTALAGTLATLGKLFGIGCGRNNDLTYDGASKWAAGLPAAAVSDVYYYTTQYKEAFLQRWCVLGADLVLSRPNDGTTERKKAQLKGANNAGDKQGWCHTTGMKFGNQCTDPERNKEMNANAAR